MSHSEQSRLPGHCHRCRKKGDDIGLITARCEACDDAVAEFRRRLEVADGVR